MSNVNPTPESVRETRYDGCPQLLSEPVSVEQRLHQEFLQCMLSKVVRVTVSDGRVIGGQVVCIDSEGNLILQKAREVKKESADYSVIGRILVPGKYITKLELAADS